MVNVTYLPEFRKKFEKLKDNALKRRIISQIEKIKSNPDVGKPMRFERKGTRELYIHPLRLSYYTEDNNLICILDLYHKDEQ